MSFPFRDAEATQAVAERNDDFERHTTSEKAVNRALKKAAARDVALVERFQSLDRALVAKGFPPASREWKRTIKRFYLSGKKQLVVRAGRRAGKSSTLCRVAVCEALWGEHKITPGDVGVVVFVSVNKDEAAQRLRLIKAILDVLGVAYRPIDGGIELADRPVAFKVFACTVASVSGFTSIAIICDEVAKWRDSDSGSNPAKEVLAALRPTMATQPSARIILISSPLGMTDAHAEAFDRGETEFQCVAHFPSWVGNPTLTEAATRALEPDERIWLREYAAIPQVGVTGAFDLATIERAIRSIDGIEADGGATVVMDSAGGRADAWTWGIAQWGRTPEVNPYMFDDLLDGHGKIIATCVIARRDEDGDLVPNPAYKPGGDRKLVIRNMGAIEGAFAAQFSSDQVVEEIARIAKRNGVRRIFSDQYQSYVLESAFASRGITYCARPWNNENKSQAIARIRQWFRDGILVIEEGPQAARLKAELLAFEERILPSGAMSYGARRGAHDDRVALLINMAIADLEGALEGSPLRKHNGRIDYDATDFVWGA